MAHGEFIPYLPINREHPLFSSEFTYWDDGTGMVLDTPFEVAVSGLSGEFFGIGKVIGSIEDDAVIELVDYRDEQAYYIGGDESYWTYPVPDEIREDLEEHQLVVNSVASYRAKIDAARAGDMRHAQLDDATPFLLGRTFCWYRRISYGD